MGLWFLLCFVGLVCLICWAVFGSRFLSFSFSFSFFKFRFLRVGSDFVGLGFVGERRGSWMLSFYSFSNFKTRATQTSLLRLCLFSLKILRSFLKILPKLCKDPILLHNPIELLFFTPGTFCFLDSSCLVGKFISLFLGFFLYN